MIDIKFYGLDDVQFSEEIKIKMELCSKSKE